MLGKPSFDASRFLACVVALCALYGSASGSLAHTPPADSCATKKVLKIGIAKSATHKALDASATGIKQELERHGYTVAQQTLVVKEESAQGNVAMAGQIATKFVAQDLDIIFAIGTWAAQSFVKFATDPRFATERGLKIIFVSVTDPLRSNIVTALDRRAVPITGVSNFVDIAPQLEVIKQLQPGLKKLGFLYNAGDGNSLIIREKLAVAARALAIDIVEQVVMKTADIPQAATRLANQADALFVSNDNTCLSGFQSIVTAAKNQGKPVYCSDTDQTDALAALGPDQVALGRQAARLAVRILKGEKAQDIPVEFPQNTQLVVNKTMAHALNIAIPDGIEKQLATPITLDSQTSTP